MSETNDVRRESLSTHRKNYFEWLKQIVAASLAIMAFLASFKVSDAIANSQCYPIFMAVDQVILLASVFTGLYAMRANWTVPLEQANKAHEAIHKYGNDQVDNFVARLGGLSSKPTIGQVHCAKACWILSAVGFFLVVFLSVVNVYVSSKSKLDSQIQERPLRVDEKYLKIIRIKNLLDSGALTRSEFDYEKTKILSDK